MDGYLDDSILFGVDGVTVLKLLAGFHPAALLTMGKAGGRAVVAGGNDSAVFDQDCANLSVETMAPAGRQLGQG